MGEFTNKVDFAVVVQVNQANPNGDPLNGNRPRETYDGFGEISDVCLKRKIRNRIQDMGENIFVQSDERSDDGCRSLAERAQNNEKLKASMKGKNKEEFASIACESWYDVRAFGQVFAFKGDTLSVGVRGPVSIHPAFSVLPINVDSIQITKSVNSETKDTKSADTMGMKHRVNAALYIIKGSINHQLAQKTGFTEEDADKLKESLRTLFVNDTSSARPDGSMEVVKLYWWKHNCQIGQYSSAKVHKLLQVAAINDDPKEAADYDISVSTLPGLEVEYLEGI